MPDEDVSIKKSHNEVVGAFMEELVSACKVFSWDIAMSYASFPLLISLSLSQLCLSLSEFGFI